METIGLRDLTHHTAAIARRVRGGETIVVTDHGKPVIRMTPATYADEKLSGLMAAGLLIPARTPGYLPEPLDTSGNWTGEDAADVISEIREDRF
jgi:prevent-host-death family protein